MSSAGEPNKDLTGSLLDVFYNAFDMLGVAYENVVDSVTGFFELWDTVSSIPRLLVPYVWAPIGISIGCIAFIALTRTIAGWGNA